jgi:hypothetical protein
LNASEENPEQRRFIIEAAKEADELPDEQAVD